MQSDNDKGHSYYASITYERILIVALIIDVDIRPAIDNVKHTHN